MHKELSNYLSHLIPELNAKGIQISETHEMKYGVQLVLERDLERNPLNIYYSEKRGISVVTGGKSNTRLFALLSSLNTKEPVSESTQHGFHEWNSWIGSDECGKGDYLGGLVVCAFALKREEIPQLKKLGVQDSKNLKDPEICRLAREVYRLFPSRISAIVLKPKKYNEIYASMTVQGKNLNDLLAWQHSSVIRDLLQKLPAPDGILVDQFSKSMKVKAALKKAEISIPVIERPKAEQDMAVATASILARYQFLQMRDSLARFYKLEIPLGTNPRVYAAARKFVSSFGKDRLDEIAKLHFVTTKKIFHAD
jgi:ribonuclease HIII